MKAAKKLAAIVVTAALLGTFLFSVCALGGEGAQRLSAVTPPWDEGQATVAQLQEFFPHGMFWNHVVGDENEAYSVTDTACSPYLDEEDLHDAEAGVTCNYFEVPGKVWGGWQCCGFARLLTYSYYGSSFENWDTATTLSEVKAGDVLYLWNYGPHYIWILSLKENGDGTAAITYADCNGTGKRSHCQIQWDALGSLDLQNNVMENPLLGDWELKKLYKAPQEAAPTTTKTTAATATTAKTPALAVRYNLSDGRVTNEEYTLSETGVLQVQDTGAPVTDIWEEQELSSAALLRADSVGLVREGYLFAGWSTGKNDTTAIAAQARLYPVSAQQAAVWFSCELEKTTRSRLLTAFRQGVRQITLYAIWIPIEEDAQ